MAINFIPDEEYSKIDFVEDKPESVINFVPENQSLPMPQENYQPFPADASLSGGIKQDVTQVWDSKGRLHFIDPETGNEIQNKQTPFEKIGRNIKAFSGNVADWIDAPPGSEAWKQKANTVLALSTLPIGASAKFTQFGANALKPLLGRKVAQSTAQGAGAGLLGGGAEGVGRGFIEGENPLLTGLQGAGLGLGFGGLGGLGLGRIGQHFAGRKLGNVGNIEDLSKLELRQFRKEARRYYKDYVQGTKAKRGDLGNINFTKIGVDETLHRNPQGATTFSDLQKNVRSAKNQSFELPSHQRTDDITGFSRLANDNEQYLIAQGKSGNRYYGTEKSPTSSTLRNSKAENGANDIITGDTENLNPLTRKSKLASSDFAKQNFDVIDSEYQVLHNADLKAQSQSLINENPQAVELDLFKKAGNDKQEFSALDFENTRNTVDRLIQEGNTEAALDLISSVSKKASEAGQAVQALSLWAKNTPEGALKQATRIIDEYNKTARKQISGLNQQQANDIIKMAQDIQLLPEGRVRDVAVGQLMKYQADLVPVNAWQKVKTIRNISLLLNPKTTVRNIVGNALFNTADTASKTLAAGIDKLVSPLTGQRTRVMPQLKTGFQGFRQGAREGLEDALKGIDTRGAIGKRWDLPQTRSFKGKVGNALETALDVSLRVPDRAFYQAAFNESVANQTLARGLKEPTEEILKQAQKEALEAVFQNEGKASKFVSKQRQSLNDLLGNEQFGLGDLVIPYAQTPANIVEQAVNYSPVGGLKAIKNAIQGNQRQATLDTARSLIGSGIGAGGYGLAKAGLATGEIDDPRTRENLALLGTRPNTINGVSYNQLQPMSALFGAGVELGSGNDAGKAVNNALSTIADMEMLSTLNKFQRQSQQEGLGSAAVSLAGSFPSQFVPTALNQINAMVDPYSRETYDPNPLKQGLNQAMVKIPGLSRNLPQRYNVKGEPIKKYESEGVQRVFDVFVNPVFANKHKDDRVVSELLTVKNNTGKQVLLPIAQKKMGDKQLTNKEFADYKHELGRRTYGVLDELVQLPLYQNSDAETKAKLIRATQIRAKSSAQSVITGEPDKSSRGYKEYQRLLNQFDKEKKAKNKMSNLRSKALNAFLDTYFSQYSNQGDK